MKPEDLAFLFLLACIVMFLLSPGIKEFIYLLIIFLFFFIIYFGPYEPKPMPTSAYVGLIIFASLWLFTEFILNIKFFTWLFMIPQSDPFTAAWSFYIPFILLLLGLYGLIDDMMRKKILGK